MSTQTPQGLLATKQPDLWFEDNAVGRLKKEIWEASDAQIDGWLTEYGFPAAGCEWAQAGSYIQTTVRHRVEANRRKNDIVLIPEKRRNIMVDFTNLWNTILTQRTWSWAVLGIIQLILFLGIRGFFFRPILKRAKNLHSKWYHELKKSYFRHSLAGWIFFLVSLLLVGFAWQTANFRNFSFYEAALVGLIALSLCLAVMAHLVALAVAAVHILKQVENNQMSL